MSEPISVTTVLDYFKEPWYIDWVCRVGKKEANRVSKAAIKVGTSVDGTLKLLPYAPLAPKKATPEVVNCVEAYKKWLGVYAPASIVAGSRLYATIDGHEVTGEPDLMVDDVLVDIKCSSKISPKYWLQVNTYAYLKRWQQSKVSLELDILDAGKVAILRLDKKTGSYEYIVKEFSGECVRVWMSMLKAYCYLKGDDNGGDEL